MRLRLTRRAENRVEWQGSSQRLDRTVALKVLPAEVAGDAERRQRFEQEARAVAKLNHPNIVAVYDMGTEHGVSFLVTELIEGESLRGVSFPLRKTIDVAVQIAEGLAAAHAAGIIHPDLKPENVMVTREGRAKILDFGLAKLARGHAEAEEATITLHAHCHGGSGRLFASLVSGRLESAADVRGERLDRPGVVVAGLAASQVGNGRQGAPDLPGGSPGEFQHRWRLAFRWPAPGGGAGGGRGTGRSAVAGGHRHREVATHQFGPGFAWSSRMAPRRTCFTKAGWTPGRPVAGRATARLCILPTPGKGAASSRRSTSEPAPNDGFATWGTSASLFCEFTAPG